MRCGQTHAGRVRESGERRKTRFVRAANERDAYGAAGVRDFPQMARRDIVHAVGVAERIDVDGEERKVDASFLNFFEKIVFRKNPHDESKRRERYLQVLERRFQGLRIKVRRETVENAESDRLRRVRRRIGFGRL